MKKYLALLLALMLLLTACSQPAQAPAADAPANDSPVSAEEEIFVDEYEKEGVKVKAYYEGGKDGTLVRAEYTMPDGSTGEEGIMLTAPLLIPSFTTLTALFMRTSSMPTALSAKAS